jgi:hypothetical protein
MAKCRGRSIFLRRYGLYIFENSGNSSIKSCENHDHRKSKVSCIMEINAGLVRNQEVT